VSIQQPLLEVKNLTVKLPRQSTNKRWEWWSPLYQMSFHIAPGEVLGVVGESGCGKSLTNLALMGLLPESAKVSAQTLNFNGASLLDPSGEAIKKIRGKRISMIFQDPMSALNPVMTIEEQLLEGPMYHLGLSKKEARSRVLSLMHEVGIPQPEERLKHYPHQFSGGLAQRIMISMALSTDPDLLIADEPTTALDVTVQRGILELLARIQRQRKLAILFVTHDISLIAGFAHRLQVMYAGEIIEAGPTFDVLNHPRHPYTQGLLACLPDISNTPRKHLPTLKGHVPKLMLDREHCSFAPRCSYADERCLKSIEWFEDKKFQRGHRCEHPLALHHQQEESHT
jgi:oligopeptide/dipeptide ABC transporter ATP-binding protein